MATYKPHSAFTQSDFNTTDYPAIKLWLPCEETSGTDFADAVGMVLRSNGTPTFGTNAAGARYVKPIASAGTIVSGTLPVVGALYPIWLAVGELVTGNVQLGVTGALARISVAATTPIINNGSDSGGASAGTNFSGVTAATTYGRAMVLSAYNSATGQRTIECTTSVNTSNAATPTDATNGDATTITSLNAFQPGWVCSSAVTALYGAQLICTTTALPLTFIQEMLAWYTAQWSTSTPGNKAPFPGLKGIS